MKKTLWNVPVDELMELVKAGEASRGRLKNAYASGSSGNALRILSRCSRVMDASVVLLLAGGMIMFMVHPACAQDFQTLGTKQEDIHDIQGIISLAGLEWWIYVGGLVALAGMALQIYLLKRKKPAPAAVESAEATAFRELDEARALLQEGMAREFSLDVSEVLRRYIEERFHVPVVQRTTEEFLQEMRRSRLAGVVSHLEELDIFLKLCDQAKFGREPLTLSEMETMWLSARNFVEQSGIALALGQNARSQTAAAPVEAQAL
jgi:hypothetical protein